MRNKNLIVGIVIIFISIAVVYYFLQSEKPASQRSSPQFNPSDFSATITNKYFALPVGRKFVYEAEKDDGIERVEIEIPGETKEIMGIKTLVYVDKVYQDGELVEYTRDYLAQDKEDNVWYFGEDVDNYEDGKLKNHAGAWIAGIDGAEPGIWLKANAKPGDSYRQEYYPDRAEDMADVVSVEETVVTKKATYQNCLQTLDYSPLEPGAKEHKYYCPEVAGLVLEVDLTSGERLELIEIVN